MGGKGSSFGVSSSSEPEGASSASEASFTLGRVLAVRIAIRVVLLATAARWLSSSSDDMEIPALSSTRSMLWPVQKSKREAGCGYVNWAYTCSDDWVINIMCHSPYIIIIIIIVII